MNEPGKNSRKTAGCAALFCKGFIMGMADVVPGVSGGTMAFILGIYEELIEATRAFNFSFFRKLVTLRFKEAFAQISWRFLLALGSGLLIAIAGLAHAISWLLEHKPTLVWSFFFGLVLASVYFVARKIDRWNSGTVLIGCTGGVAAFVLCGMIPRATPDAPWFIFLSGILAICAMMLPGISGSFVLVLLGKYQFMITAIKEHHFVTLAIFALGAATGIISFAHVLNWLLKHYHRATLACLTGLMIGSLRKIWPFQLVEETGKSVLYWPTTVTGEVVTAATWVIVGVAVVLLVEGLSSRASFSSASANPAPH